ncbi:hypothetical protein Tco_1145908 [Tanacetum coccineum]
MASLEFYDNHNMVAYLEKSKGSEGFHQIIDFLTASHIKNALTECPTLYASPIEQFWQTAALSTNEDGVRGITATIDRKAKVFVSEAFIRRHLKLEDSEGLKTLPTTEIFEQLALMGFFQIFLNKRKRMLLPHKRTFPTPTLTQKLFSNMKRDSKGYSGVEILLFPTMLTTPESSPSRITSSPSLSPQTHSSTLQPPSIPQSNQTTPVTEEAAPMPHESPLQSVHSLRRDEGSLSLNELKNLCTSLSKKVKSLDVGKIDCNRLNTGSITVKSGSNSSNLYNQKSKEVSTASRLVSTADISTASELDSTTGVKAKDKGKAIMHESDPPKKIKKREARFKAEQEQERIDFETALELKKQLDEREEVAAKVDQAHDNDWSDPAVLRYHTLQNRSFFVAENQAFIPKDFEIEKEVMKRSGFDLQQEFVKKDEALSFAHKQPARGSRKKSLARKRARETLSEESAKKQTLEDDTKKEELQVYLKIVPEEESLNIESLATKYRIVDWETQILADDKYYYHIKRAYGSVKHYKIFSAMFYDFDRQDVLELYRLVK